MNAINKNRRQLFVFLFTALLGTYSAYAQQSGLTDASNNCIFTPEFIKDYDTAQSAVDQQKSAEPYLALLTKYQKPEEKAELELSIGLVYNQHGGSVDPAKAIIHLSRALEFNSPEKNYIQIYMWRGGSYEQLKKPHEAIRDYLRALLTCSYWDLSGGWQAVKPPTIPIYSNSSDPENEQRTKDYNRYHKAVTFNQFLLMSRYSLIEAAKRVKADGKIDDATLEKTINELTPDASRRDQIIALIKSKNERPWP